MRLLAIIRIIVRKKSIFSNKIHLNQSKILIKFTEFHVKFEKTVSQNLYIL